MLAVLSLSFTNLTEESNVIPPAQQQQIADTLEDDAEVMSNTQLERCSPPGAPRTSRRDPRLNAEARDRPSVALLVPILAGLLGVLAPSG